MMGVFPLNESVAIGRSRDKLRSLQLLARDGVGLPITAFTNDAGRTDEIIKTRRRGAGGHQAARRHAGHRRRARARRTNRRRSVIEAFHGAEIAILVQQYVKEARGPATSGCSSSAARRSPPCRRTGAEGEFRSNLHRGGQAESDEDFAGGAGKHRRNGGEDPWASTSAASTCLRAGRGPGGHGGQFLAGPRRHRAVDRSVDVASQIIEFLEKNAKTGPYQDQGQGMMDVKPACSASAGKSVARASGDRSSCM